MKIYGSCVNNVGEIWAIQSTINKIKNIFLKAGDIEIEGKRDRVPVPSVSSVAGLSDSGLILKDPDQWLGLELGFNDRLYGICLKFGYIFLKVFQFIFLVLREEKILKFFIQIPFSKILCPDPKQFSWNPQHWCFA